MIPETCMRHHWNENMKQEKNWEIPDSQIEELLNLIAQKTLTVEIHWNKVFGDTFFQFSSANNSFCINGLSEEDGTYHFYFQVYNNEGNIVYDKVVKNGEHWHPLIKTFYFTARDQVLNPKQNITKFIDSLKEKKPKGFFARFKK